MLELMMEALHFHIELEWAGELDFMGELTTFDDLTFQNNGFQYIWWQSVLPHLGEG